MEDLHSFTGATRGNTSCCEPPATQIAVSSTRVFEAVNLTGFVFDHGGSKLGSFDPVSLMTFGKPNNFGSDPRVVYDAGIDRWYMVLMVCQQATCDGNWTTMGVDLAVSQSNNPLGSWLVYQNLFSLAPFSDQGNMQDQPKLGFSADKVTISVNVYSGHCSSGSCFIQENVIVFNKASLFQGSAYYEGFTSGFAFDAIPAIPTPTSASSSDTQFVAWQGFGSLAVNQITGVPKVSSVGTATQNLAIGNMTATVNASGIPAGAQPDNQLESVTWNRDRLWAASTDGCTRGGGTVDCTRIDEVDTSNSASLSVLLDQDVGDAGAYEIYPSVTQDCVGDLMWGITYSDGSTRPSAAMVGSPTPGSETYSRVDYATADTTYSGGRWGDSSGIQEDPSDCGDVWTAQEYGAVGSSGNWATGLGQFSFDSPFVSSVSPNTGPATGGTLVDINGFDFVDGGTSVKFGSTPAAAVFFVDAHHIQALSPPGAGGPVDITATTSNGTTPTLSADQFSWVPTVTKIKPNAGPTSGGTPVDITGKGFTGATAVHFGATAVPMLVKSDSDITATAPAHAAGTVNVTVTGPTGTSAPSTATVYAFGPPAVTRLTPNGGSTTGGNMVTITGTGFVPGATVKFSSAGAALPSTFVATTQLKVTAPAHAAGVVTVLVTTPGGTSAASNAALYAFGPPGVSSFSPALGITGSSVTIKGTGFVPGASVTFGALASPLVTFLSPAQLTAVVPNGAVLAKISVTTAAGTGTSSTNFKPTLSITSFSPTSGPTGTLVTITGIGFNSTSAVKFNGTTATSVNHVSSTTLKATVPATATAGPISVTNTTGTTGTVRSATKYTKT